MQDKVLEKIKRAMESFSCMADSADILCAVSGGADSVCLMLSLRELGYPVCAVHVEHGIRGRESLDDCAYVRRLCTKEQIPLHVVSVDAPSVSRAQGMSLEEAARILRHDALNDTAIRLGIRVIATAHHRMDQAETVLWNLIRGSSLGGLGGIRPLRRKGDVLLIRPMIDCEKAEIEAYLKKRNVPWREDSTNADTHFTRNAIRQNVMPLLTQLNPAAIRHIARAAEDLQDVETWLEDETVEALRAVSFSRVGEEGFTADRHALKQMPEVIRRRVLHRLIAECAGSRKDISRAHVLALEHVALGPNGHETDLPGGLYAVSEEGILRLQRRSRTCRGDAHVPAHETPRHGGMLSQETPERGDVLSQEMPAHGGVLSLENSGTFSFPQGDGAITIEVSYTTWPGGAVPKKKYTKYLAYDTMAPCPVMRTRRSGDYLIVHASGSRKKLKDYLIDEKIPRDIRGSIPVIAQGSHVLWVVGMRISEGAKVSEGTRCMRVAVCDGKKAERECISFFPEGGDHERNRKSPDSGRQGG